MIAHFNQRVFLDNILNILPQFLSQIFKLNVSDKNSIKMSRRWMDSFTEKNDYSTVYGINKNISPHLQWREFCQTFQESTDTSSELFHSKWPALLFELCVFFSAVDIMIVG